MKKILTAILAAVLLLAGNASADFSTSSMQFNPELALKALQIAETCYTPSAQETLLAQEGFRRTGLYNMNRPAGDTRHTAAYAVYDRETETGRTEVIIAVRGTGDGEWKLNLELMPSGNYDLPYAENFSLAADDILSTLGEYLDALASPVFLVTGHSRGAAVANILGARLTDRFQAENVFVYTFAAPRTVRGTYPDYPNLFNVINPADAVTYLPFPEWGFERYGTDVELPVEDASLLEAARQAYGKRPDREGAFCSPQGLTEAARLFTGALVSLAPQVKDGYTVRHALAHPGEAEPEEDGMTAGEFLLMIFDGNLLSGSSRVSQQIARSENDFTPVLAEIRSLSTGSGFRWISEMHKPAMYGAWLAVMGYGASTGLSP